MLPSLVAPVFRRAPVLFAAAIAAAALAGGCGKPKSPPAEILVKYHKDAKRLCTAITACIKKDVGARLKDQPERRKMVMNRMTRDLCVKKQSALIGKLSTDPSGKGFAYNPENYKAYAECSRVVAAASECNERKRLHRTHASCRRLRGIFSKSRR